MAVNKRASYTIKPSETTWEGVASLSEWDQTGVITHVPVIYFYKPSKEWLESSKSIIDTLKESLSRALVHFYPLAGRVRWVGQGRLELLCNAKGVELIEAESSNELSDFGDFLSCTRLFKDLIPNVVYDKPIDEIPLVFGQLTVFQCGGVSLGVTMSHIVVDGQSAQHFMHEWARLARGEQIEVAPFIDCTLLQGKGSHKARVLTQDMEYLSQPPLLLGQDNSLAERSKATEVSILPLSKEQMESLKRAANQALDYEKLHPYSRYEVVTSHIWRTACKARGHQYQQLTCLGFSIDVRGRLDPPLPKKYFGNAILEMVVLATAGEVMTKPFSFTCGKIREAIEKVNSEYIWTNIELLKSLPDLKLVQYLNDDKGGDGPFYGNPNLGVISWLTLPLYGLDFGWGKEIYMGPGSHDFDGDCLILPGPAGDGSVRVALCLQVAHIDDFKKYFYQDIPCQNN